MKFTSQPVKYPKLRNAGLSSVKGATFGLVRNNGTRNHQGIDLEVSPNFRIYAVENGEIVNIKTDDDNGHGLAIWLKMDCPNKSELHGKIAFYSHLNRIDVKVGEKVKAGVQLGLTGYTGNAKKMRTIKDGSHLHFEIRTKIWAGLGLQNRIDPLPFIELIY